jgi:S1-C subfamily serine protease
MRGGLLCASVAPSLPVHHAPTWLARTVSPTLSLGPRASGSPLDARRLSALMSTQMTPSSSANSATAAASRISRTIGWVLQAARTASQTICVFLFALLITVPVQPLPAAFAAPPLATETGLPAIVRTPEAALDPGSAAPGGLKRRQKSSFVTAAVDTVGPAVVRIDTERLVDRQPIEGYLFPGVEPDGQRRESGQGSGVILNEEGLILTNAHVVKNAAKVTVTLTDGRNFEGTVKGSDEYMDLAAVKIKPSGRRLPTAPLGRSDELQVGDWVIAIGNAVGLDSTVTLGIVSSLSRSAAEVGIPNKKVNFIQTDAAINPGNSGGPLLNEFGEVIGINTAIRANAAGIGFAIPIDTAEKAIKELSLGRKIAHAYLGISMSSLTPDSARQNNADPNSNVELPELDGALVLAVAPDTPAAKAGFRKFDLIQELGGKPIKNAADAQAAVDGSKVGQPLVAKIVRQQKTLTLSVVTGDLSERAPPKF